jgi:hypothetical protein
MRKSGSIRACGMLVFAAFLGGCAGASWQKVEVAPGYQPPKELKIAMVGQSSSQHAAEALQALQASIEEGLKSHKITATFVTAPSGPPEAGMTVVEWDQGSKVLRWLIGFGAGEGAILVQVKSPSADGQAGLDGTARGWVKGGWFGGDSYASAVEAGHLIAKAIATGKAK